MTGMVMIVTGASSGIGHEVAHLLAEGGNDVTLAGRDADDGLDALRRIRSALPNSIVQFLQLDLSSTYSIRSFVKEFMRSRRRLDVLVNNAAMALNCRDLTRRKTKDGIEVTMATNYFGPFLLTHLLLEYMIQTSNIYGEARIINVTCSSHDHRGSLMSRGLHRLSAGDLQLEKGPYSGRQAYKNSKLCNVLFTYSLASRLRESRLLINAVDPGAVATTRLNRHADSLDRSFARCCLHGVLRPLAVTARKTLHQSAMQVVSVATSARYEGRSGKFFRDGVEERSSIESYDADLQNAVWKQSCHLVGIHSMISEETADDISLGSMKDGLD